MVTEAELSDVVDTERQQQEREHVDHREQTVEDGSSAEHAPYDCTRTSTSHVIYY